jgi:hypothetical protein
MSRIRTRISRLPRKGIIDYASDGPLVHSILGPAFMWLPPQCSNSAKKNCQSQSRQPSRVVEPFPALHMGGGGHPPLSHWPVGGGDLYIYTASYTQHNGLLGRLLHEVLQLLMWWKSQWPLKPAKEPPALPSAVFHHLFWNYGIIFGLTPRLP